MIPAAGLGTRFLPATKAIPKEMIPIIDIPMIQYIVEEAVKSGIETVILISATNKQAIKNHFDYHPELEEFLLNRQQSELANASRALANLCNLKVVIQDTPLGLGHAVLTAEAEVGNEPFAILLGDDLIDADLPCTRQLIEVFNTYQKSVVGIMEVAETEVSKYGIVGGVELEQSDSLLGQKRALIDVKTLVEKPAAEQSPSRFAIPGRYVLNSSIFNYIRQTKPGRNGEIQLTDALQLMAEHEGLLAYLFSGIRYDTGDRLGLIEATLAFALKRKELRADVQKMMRRYLDPAPI